MSVRRRGVFSNFGPQVSELELRFSEFFGVDPERVVLAGNATLALQGLIQNSHSAHWEIPSWTFAATAHAAYSSGKSFTFVDVLEQNWMTPVKERGQSSFGQLTVLPFGVPLFDFGWGDEAEVIIDAAASLGSMEKSSLMCLPNNTSVAFSLHATKVLGVGEGSVVVFGSHERANTFREWTNFGFSGSRSSKFIGTNGKLSEYVACLLHSELDNWDAIKREWIRARGIVDRISTELNIANQPGSRGVISPYWVVDLQSENSRVRAQNKLSASGINSRRWWEQGCHQMPAFSKIPRGHLPITSSLASKTLGLPFFRGITEKQVVSVARIISAISR